MSDGWLMDAVQEAMDADPLFGEGLTFENYRWRCVGCDVTWEFDDLQQVGYDGHFACPQETCDEDTLRMLYIGPHASVSYPTATATPENVECPTCDGDSAADWSVGLPECPDCTPQEEPHPSSAVGPAPDWMPPRTPECRTICGTPENVDSPTPGGDA